MNAKIINSKNVRKGHTRQLPTNHQIEAMMRSAAATKAKMMTKVLNLFFPEGLGGLFRVGIGSTPSGTKNRSSMIAFFASRGLVRTRKFRYSDFAADVTDIV